MHSAVNIWFRNQLRNLRHLSAKYLFVSCHEVILHTLPTNHLPGELKFALYTASTPHSLHKGFPVDHRQAATHANDLISDSIPTFNG